MATMRLMSAPQQQVIDPRRTLDVTEKQGEAVLRIQRWWRAQTSRTGKLHKVLRQALFLARGDADDDDENAKHMDFKYWIEAADKRHRYGTQLAPYYKKWLEGKSSQPFFTWLDRGAGKDLDLKASPRAKLEKSSVTYFEEKDRLEYEVDFVPDEEGGVLLCWKRTDADGDHVAGELINAPGKWSYNLQYRLGMPTSFIFVVDGKDRLFVHAKQKGVFHHSSFLSGQLAHCAGGIVIEDGVLTVLNGSSGHYKPTRKMVDKVCDLYEENYGLDRDSYTVVYPATRKLCGPCTPSCLCFKKIPTIPSNFPC